MATQEGNEAYRSRSSDRTKGSDELTAGGLRKGESLSPPQVSPHPFVPQRVTVAVRSSAWPWAMSEPSWVNNLQLD